MKKLNKRFNEAIDEWLEFKRLNVKKSTYYNYKFVIDKRIRNELGEMNIYKLAEYDFNKFICEMSKSLSKKTLSDTIILLKQILKFVGRKYNIDYKFDLITIPKLEKNDSKIFNDNEIKILSNYLLKSREIKNMGILISLYEGLRIGEVCSLKWGDINFEDDEIKVQNTMQRIYLNPKETVVITGKPKTKNSIRSIPISKKIEKQLRRNSIRFSKNSYVLTGDENKFIEPIYYRNYYKKVLDGLDVPYKKYHSLRHTFATRCIKTGMDVKSLSEILGHSNVGITMNIYVHSDFDTKRKYMNML